MRRPQLSRYAKAKIHAKPICLLAASKPHTSPFSHTWTPFLHCTTWAPNSDVNVADSFHFVFGGPDRIFRKADEKTQSMSSFPDTLALLHCLPYWTITQYTFAFGRV